MKILIHDYAGHPFPVSLSRRLAEQGHQVIHSYSEHFQTPRGSLRRMPKDPDSLSFYAIPMNENYVRDKYSFINRRRYEIGYGKQARKYIEELKPDIVLSGNTPTDIQGHVIEGARSAKSVFIYWVQDFYSIAISEILKKKLPFIGSIIGKFYQNKDRKHFSQSDAIICITEDFLPQMEDWNISPEKCYVIPNWAEIEAIPLTNKNNNWCRAHELEDKFTFLYSGTLGMKHNPVLIEKLAIHFTEDPSVRIVVNSEGLGADYLSSQKELKSLDNLHINNYQPFEQFSEVLGSADILLSLLEPAAGQFSVPSKTLSYFCSGRPILASMPKTNLASKLIHNIPAGIVVDPSDEIAWLKAADNLKANETDRLHMGKQARHYAESHFQITEVTNRFEALFEKLIPTPKVN